MATLWKHFAVSVVIVFGVLVSTSQAGNGHVAIGNGFQSPTQFTCNSNVMARQTYLAAPNEIYYFAFDTDAQQYWDCQVHNVGFGKSGTFRFWGDNSHGGAQLFSCVDCKWTIDLFGISLYVNNDWLHEYSWPRSTTGN